MLSTEELCIHLTHLLHAPIRCYNNNGIYIKQYQGLEQQDPIIQDQDFEKMLLNKANYNFPALYFEFNSAIYGIIKTEKYGNFILGPCSLINDNHLTADKIAKEHNITKEYKVSFCTLETFCSICSMLFHHCTGVYLNWNEIITLSTFNDMIEQDVQKQINNVVFSYQEQCKIHNPYEQEKREQDSIRHGDLEGLKKSFKETYVGEVGTLAKTPLRHSQNIAITLIALASRSAIDGGISPEIAYSISDSYILQIEDVLQPSDAIYLARQAEAYYTRLVAEHIQGLEKNSLIERCKNKIQQNICSKIRVSSLADELGVNPNYLSEKFAKEEGVSLVSYINKQKIEFSKHRLRYSDDTYGTIAYILGFSSQSHFTSVFKKITGITPKQYRDKYKY